MIVQIDLFWLAGLVLTLLAYRPLFSSVVKAVQTAVKAYKFALNYVELPHRQRQLELRVDDIESVVFREGATS